MEIQTVQLEELMKNPDQYIDSVVVTEGILIVQEDKATLCIESDEESVCLKISDDDFLDRLLDNVPCYVGGKYLYCDSASIIGSVFLEKNNFYISCVVRISIFRGGEVFNF
ncbi:hypothetical protein HNQ59_003962 [Chitinivorax tropicus]|uniref:Uncharacterized protein n=1 Tax=Chitinivorax tropicus TaxID=714531 RepID=A0A840MTS0_9PROT|nr:hypothetical protein [Chitinivorax tropicus]MBB5020637.1 hypothetical protein [Chitinivorax tropicus]